MTEGVPEPRSSAPPHPHRTTGGPNVELEFICTVHVDRCASFHIRTFLNEHFLTTLRSTICNIRGHLTQLMSSKVNTQTELTKMQHVDDALDVQKSITAVCLDMLNDLLLLRLSREEKILLNACAK